MTRSCAREIAVHLVFELSFSNQTADELLESALTRPIFDLVGGEEPLYQEFPNEKQRLYIAGLVRGVYLHCAELDEYISRYAIGWNFARLPRVIIAILRVAMYEILYVQDVPEAVAINAAVNISKRYEEVEIVSFLNGILGTFVRKEQIPVRSAVPVEEIFDSVPDMDME